MMEVGDGLEDAFEVGVELVIGVAENAVAEGVEIRVPVAIVGGLGCFFVDGAVELEDEPQIVAEEVRDVGADRYLTAEFEAVELPVAQAVPQLFFGFRHGSPQQLCAFSCALVGESHGNMIPQRRRPSSPRPSSPSLPPADREKRERFV